MSQPANRLANSISRTSLYVAAGRAIGARERDPAARNPDHLAATLLGDPSALGVDHPVVRAMSLDYDEAMRDGRVVSNVRRMIVRTRYIDEVLQRAVADGTTQVVIQGAGFDTHAYRCQELLKHVRVFEVDRPTTQAFKQERVNAVLGGPPPNLTYVASDFAHDGLRDDLMRHGHDPAQKTFFILEGVTMYVPEANVRDTLRFVASHVPGSAIVFDFVYRTMIDMLSGTESGNVPEAARPVLQRLLKTMKDEPWLFGIPVGGEREFLNELGLELQEVLPVGGEESLKRYLTRADGTQVGNEVIGAGRTRIAYRASAAEPSVEAEQILPERMHELQQMMSYQIAWAIVAQRS